MTRRTPIVLALSAVAIASALGCQLVFPIAPPNASNEFFQGCFRGPFVSNPAQPTLTIVVQAPADQSGLSVNGCLLIASAPPIGASFVGMVRPDQKTTADITVTQTAGGPTLDLFMERTPEGDHNAESISLIDANGNFRAPNLQPCTETCASLGIAPP